MISLRGRYGAIPYEGQVSSDEALNDLYYLGPEIEDDGYKSAELYDRNEGSPLLVVFHFAHQLSCDCEMSGAADRNEFGQPLNEAKYEGVQK